MVNSRLKKEAKLGVDAVKSLAEAASKYVVEWTTSEARRLLRQELVITETARGYQVGKFTVENSGVTWIVNDQWGALINYFSCKKSAIIWCLLSQTGKLTASQKLLKEDSLVNKLSQDITYYTFGKQRALKNGDYFKADLCDARLTSTALPLSRARDDLEKTLNSAKYLKGIWEKPL